jgi:hypothetical protein
VSSGIEALRSSAAIRRLTAASSGMILNHGVPPDQRIALEVHLRDEPLRKSRAEHREVDVRRSPAVDVVPPGIRARLDGAEGIVAVVVGEGATAAAEVGVDRRDVVVVAVTVASAGVSLPGLDKGAWNAAAVLVAHVPMHDDALADRLTFLGVVQDEVVVQRTEFVLPEDRARYLGQGVLERP